MLPRGRAGVRIPTGRPSFAPPSEPVIGNALPAWTGSPGNTLAAPAPHPATQPMGGQVGTYDGSSGADPAAAKVQPPPRVDINGAEQENWNRRGIIGFNDQQQVRDRHAYWSRGHGRNFGGLGTGDGRNPNLDGPPMPTLRTVNISVNPQIGSDASRNADDLSRAYTWLGQQDGSTQPVYGGVPGLVIPYGTRGGWPLPIVDPTNGEGGPRQVISGPPHGLHSDTLPSGKQIADRYTSTPQMRPVRFDRPDNSRIAGQSYSETVAHQGASAPASAGASRRGGLGVSVRVFGRGWAGR